MAMKLESALKLYIALYVVCFLLTWFISVPMLIHVAPESECLLFVTPYIKFGNPFGCHFVGFTPVLVAAAALILIGLHISQLRALKVYLRSPGHHSRKEYHQNRPPHIFWKMVIFHGVVTLVVLVVAVVLTIGYVDTCNNLYREVRTVVRGRVEADQWGGGEGSREQYDKFANDHSIDRYTNRNRDMWGRNSYEHGITCRNILTDPEITYKLKQNHANNPLYRQYYGFWYRNDISDVGNIRYYTTRNNLILEMSMGAIWISFAVWLLTFVLMLWARHHVRAHLTDESMFGSEFGGSQRSRSRSHNQEFDKMSSSRYSAYSGSQVSHSGSRRPPSSQTPKRHHQPNSYPAENMSYQGSLQMQSAPSATGKIDPHQNTLMDYFSKNPPLEEEVDVDAALEDHNLDKNPNPDPDPIPQAMDVPDYPMNYPPDASMLDHSFDLPLDTTMNDPQAGPYPLGDDVSNGKIRHIPVHVEQNHQPTMPMSHNHNRQTGRRGRGSQPVSPSPIPPPMAEGYPPYQPQDYPPSGGHNDSLAPSHSGYKMHLGNQSMI